MHYKKDFNAFVGGTSGVFKGVKINQKACIMKNIQSLTSITADHEVTAISWGDDDEKEILLACGSKGDRSVKIYDTQYGAFTSSFVCNTGKGIIKGLSRYDNAVITAVESGHIKLWRFDENDQVLIEAGENLERMRHSNVNKNIIATGGKEHKLQLFDLAKQTKVFTEKNVRHDWLELEVPLWISDIGFVPNSSHVVTCSKFGHVRLYDPAAQKRPVINLEIKDEALTTLAVTPQERHIVVGSGKGIMKLIDLRQPGRILNTYKDFVGSITAVACPKSNPYIVSVGLDRYLRVHHMNTKELLKKIYLTSRLSCMVLRSDFSLETVDEVQGEPKKRDGKRSLAKTDENDELHITNVESGSEAEYDEIFENMAVIRNEENEANLTENETERSKTKTVKLRSRRTTNNSLSDGRKRLKKSRDRTGKTA